ncbi:MAG: DUF2304 domain-containing protein [Theionarchaea archaeon]|nr:DUF2304 domain-containing protein [Theionarchaea archaeon]MBU7038356.1 DUF2304 domain-containing protein [Theionarchaea archaeon]
MVSLIHVGGFLLGCYFLLRSYLLVKNKKEEVQDFLVWGTVGASLLVLSAVPQVGDLLAEYLSIRTRTNTIFALSIFLLYLLMFRMHTLNRDLYRQISVLNEELSLLRHRLENQ